MALFISDVMHIMYKGLSVGIFYAPFASFHFHVCYKGGNWYCTLGEYYYNSLNDDA